MKSTACQRHFLCNPEDHLYSVTEYSKQKLSYCCPCLCAYTHLLQKPRGYQGEKASQELTLWMIHYLLVKQSLKFVPITTSNAQKSSCVVMKACHTQVSKFGWGGQLFFVKLTACVRRAQEGSHEDICEVAGSTELGVCSLSGRPYRDIPILAKLLGLQVLRLMRERPSGVCKEIQTTEKPEQPSGLSCFVFYGGKFSCFILVRG